MNKLVRWIFRNSRIILLVSIVLSVISAYFSVLLYKNLRTSMEELLPHTARSVVDSNEVKDRLESTENLAILIFSKKPDASRRFVDDFAAKLKTLPKELASRIEHRIDDEVEFFQKRKALFISVAELQSIRNYVRDRIEYEKELYNPLNIFRSTELPEPYLNVNSLKGKYDSQVSSYTKFPDGYYANADQTIRAVMVYLSGTAMGISKAKALRKEVDQIISDLNPDSYDPEMTIRFTGGAQNIIEEHQSLIADLELSMIVVMILVTLALIVFYRSLISPFLLILSLLMGTLWTFGVSFFTVGYLNANSAFLGAIVIGNGINFGLIQLARYVEERRRNRGHFRALHTAMTKTLMATCVAALAAGLAYGSLYLTEFRGFKQFGIIGLIGMVLCWLSAYVTLPAFLTVVDQKFSLAPKSKPPVPYFSKFVSYLIRNYSVLIWLVSLVLIGASIVLSLKFEGQMIETDTSKLRDKKSMTEGSGYLSIYMDEIFERYMSPVVILPRENESTPIIVSRLEKYKKDYGKKSLVSAVYSLDNFVPKDQERKIEILKEIRKYLTPRVREELTGQDRQLAQEFLTPEVFKTFSVNELPKMVLDRFREKDGSLGKIVLVEPPLDKELLRNGDYMVRFITNLRNIADSVDEGTPVAGQLPVTADMYQAVRRDGPKATFFALLAVVVLVVILFRSKKIIFLVLTALGFGVIGLVGIMFGWDLKINFLNFIALPITFGIGVDYAVNIFQRYKLEGKGSILKVIEGTGGAVTLASLTTIIGYGSLHLAGNQAFVSFGRLSVLGEITCLLAALLFLPSLVYYYDNHTESMNEEAIFAKKLFTLKGDTTALVRRLMTWVIPSTLIIFAYVLTSLLLSNRTIGISTPYVVDQDLFAIMNDGVKVSLNQFLKQYHQTWIDILAGVSYYGSALFIIAFVVMTLEHLSKKGTRMFSKEYFYYKSHAVVWGLVTLFCLSSILHATIPTIGPWYWLQNGFRPFSDAVSLVPDGPARLDALLGISLFGRLSSGGIYDMVSFPVVPVLLAAMCIYFFVRFRIFRFGSLLAGLLICLSAVYLDLHYLHEVIISAVVGYLFGWLVDVISAFILMKQYEKKFPEAPPPRQSIRKLLGRGRPQQTL